VSAQPHPALTAPAIVAAVAGGILRPRGLLLSCDVDWRGRVCQPCGAILQVDTRVVWQVGAPAAAVPSRSAVHRSSQDALSTRSSQHVSAECHCSGSSASTVCGQVCVGSWYWSSRRWISCVPHPCRNAVCLFTYACPTPPSASPSHCFLAAFACCCVSCRGYIISMLWATATSLIIHNSGLPPGETVMC
jgi:hypothetical protein